MLSFCGELLPTINVGDFVGNHVGDIKGGKKKFDGNAKKAGILRHEGKGNVGVWVILEQGNTNS